MPNFRTVLSPIQAPFSIDYQSHILCIGSCFTENIGQLLTQNKFSTLLNPYGILYNPISIKNTLEGLLSKKKYLTSDLFFDQDLWHSFDHHGHFSHTNQHQTLEKINRALLEGQQVLTKTDRLFLTFGTANVFIKKSTREIVANCHKVPSINFVKKRLTITEIVDGLLPTFVQLKNFYPDLEIILTVSPVRHIRDGFLENQRSKATLLLAIEALIKRLDFVHYFPAYELVLDDLRDYRFYDSDMVHPNEFAIQYIWEYFQQTYFSNKTNSIRKLVKKIVQASKHRPFHPHTLTHQQFISKQLKKIEALVQQYPFLKLTKEQEIFQAQLV